MGIKTTGIGAPGRWLPGVLLLLLVFAASAAGVYPSPAAAADQKPDAVVEIVNISFKAEKITIKAGNTVEWRNTSLLAHTVTADPALAAKKSSVQLPDGAETFNSGILNPNATFRHTFTVPGTYRYFCMPHEATGMVGEIIVEKK